MNPDDITIEQQREFHERAENAETKAYWIHRVKCKRCGDVIEFGAGTDVSPFSLTGGEWEQCRCGYVKLFPYENEAYRIYADDWPNSLINSDDVEDMSIEWSDDIEWHI